MTLKIDQHRSRPVWPKRYNDALKKGVDFGMMTEQEATHERGAMFRILRGKKPVRQPQEK